MSCYILQAAKFLTTHIIIISADESICFPIYFWKKLTRLGCLGLWFDNSYKKKLISACYLAGHSFKWLRFDQQIWFKKTFK